MKDAIVETLKSIFPFYNIIEYFIFNKRIKQLFFRFTRRYVNYVIVKSLKAFEFLHNPYFAKNLVFSFFRIDISKKFLYAFITNLHRSCSDPLIKLRVQKIFTRTLNSCNCQLELFNSLARKTSCFGQKNLSRKSQLLVSIFVLMSDSNILDNHSRIASFTFIEPLQILGKPSGQLYSKF